MTEEVIVYDYTLNEVKRIPLDWKDTPRVNVGGLCVDEETGEIHLYSSVFGLYRYVFDSAGHLKETQKLPDSIIWNVMTYTLTPQYIYYRERDPIYADWFFSPFQDIYRYDLQTGETELLLEDVSDFTFIGGGQAPVSEMRWARGWSGGHFHVGTRGIQGQNV